MSQEQEVRNLRERVAGYERSLIEEALGAAGGNQRRAAAALGVLPTTLHEKMRRLGLSDAHRVARSAPAGHDAAEGR
jgi:DNA-binding NtrC family response regulator